MVTQKEMLARRFEIMPRKLWLYRDGDECVGVTGGWIGFNQYGQYEYDAPIFNSDNILVKAQYSAGPTVATSCLKTALKFDITNYSMLAFDVSDTIATKVNTYCTLGVKRNAGREAFLKSFAVMSQMYTGTAKVDVSEITGLVCIQINADAYAGSTQAASTRIHRVWLE